MRDRQYLFTEYDLRGVIAEQEEALKKEVSGLSRQQILQTEIDKLVEYFVEKYTLLTPKLIEAEISVEEEESKIDVRYDQNRYITDRSRPFYMDATRISFYIPYEGDPDLFKCNPSLIFMNPHEGEIEGNNLVLRFLEEKPDQDKIKGSFEGRLNGIKEVLTKIESMVAGFNNELENLSRSQLQSRKDRLLENQGVAASFGFPLRKRANSADTYIANLKPKRIEPRLPDVPQSSSTPEPTMGMEQYEDILKIISGMVHVIERSPKAFSTMQEEDLRQHFLVQLNGQYEGKGTGETFNYKGKTDILVREQDKNLFIAECKFWKGEKAFSETIDQLLGYTSWRDTKTAIIVFNRNKNLSKVLDQIPEVVKKHPNYVEEQEYNSETGFRYIMSRTDDQQRKIIVTVLVFEIPDEKQVDQE